MPRLESRGGRFFEVEVEDTTVTQIEGAIDGSQIGEPVTRTFPTADDARYAAARLIATRRRRLGYRLIGAARHLGGGPGEPAPPVSGFTLEAYFAAADPRFLPALLRANAAAQIAGLAERWYRDARPWAREALRAYIDDGGDRPYHKALVKRLFKLAEAAGDDDLMTRFLVAFDRLSRRYLLRRTRYAGWDPATRQAIVHETTHLAQDPSIPARLPGREAEAGDDAAAGARRSARPSPPADEPLFTKATRRYLARRAYRYFRKLAHADLARYGRAMRQALPRYTDASLATASRLLDAWGLMHALYARSTVIVRSPSGIRLADGKSLGDLAPAPHFDAAWDGVFGELLALAVAADSRTVRTWTVAMLRARYASELAALGFAEIKQLVTSPHDEVVALGVAQLTRMPGLDTLPLADWLALLAIPHLDVLPAIAELAARHLSPAQLDLPACIDLALSQTAPVAELGLRWARTKPIVSAEDLRAIARLARAGVAAVRSDGTIWALGVIAEHPAAGPEHVRELCDGPHADARAHALATVTRTERFVAEPALWLALAESPYPDVRAVVVRHVARWRDQAPAATLRHVWATALLSIHGSSKVKARVPRQIADHIAAHPEAAGALLPVLGHALRSVRPAERALALGALARAARAQPALAELAQRVLPELTLSPQVSS